MRKIKVGIGFATGRRSFQKVLKTNILNWKECGLTQTKDISLNLFVAYDLKYTGTTPSDYKNIHVELRDMVDGAWFIGNTKLREETAFLLREGAINTEQARLLFGSGYAGKRNAILYQAFKQNMDYVLFLDDDEYPMAVTNTRDVVVWSGQHVLKTHLHHIQNADITFGYHCGYISPIPSLEFNQTLTEEDFRTWIQALSNDILNWDNMRKIIRQGGVTYADTGVLVDSAAVRVPEVNHAKFIAGSNLCINLTNPMRVQPFYNPPEARGEDTFLSTCLEHREVLRVPCYTFHDGFSAYRHLMDGVLPLRLKPICANTDQVVTRFYNACVGWVRYKPLYLFITQREHYEENIRQMHKQIDSILPKLCRYFGRDDFMNISKELERYHRNVEKHYEAFQETRRAWDGVTACLTSFETEGNGLSKAAT